MLKLTPEAMLSPIAGASRLLTAAPRHAIGAPREAARLADALLRRSLSELDGRLRDSRVQASTLLRSGAHAAELRARSRLQRIFDEVLLGVVDLLAERLLTDAVLERVLGQAERAELAQQLIDRMLEHGIAEQIAHRVLSGPEVQRILADMLTGRFLDEAVVQLLQTEALWVLVDGVAGSESVAEAITRQGTGFADQVTARLRERSAAGDARIQRLADRMIARRRTQPQTGSG